MRENLPVNDTTTAPSIAGGENQQNVQQVQVKTPFPFDDKPIAENTSLPGRVPIEPDFDALESGGSTNSTQSESNKKLPIPTVTFKFKPSTSATEIPVYQFESIRTFPSIGNQNDYTHDVRLAQDEKGITWVVKKTIKPKLSGRELQHKNRQNEAETAAREVYFAEMARFLDPHLPEYRVGRDSEGNYYVLSQLKDFRSFNELFAHQSPLDEKTDYKKLIADGELRGAARTGIINLMVLEFDGAPYNIGLFKKSQDFKEPYISENVYPYVIGQLDRGQAGIPKLFTQGNEDNVDKYLPTADNIEKNPVLHAPEGGKGFNPKYWFDVLARNRWDQGKSKLFDADSYNNLVLRQETNETLLNAELMTYEIISVLSTKILGQYHKKADIQKVFVDQKTATINAGLLAHKDDINLHKSHCFRNYVYKKFQAQNQAESKSDVTAAAKKHLESFTTYDQKLFDTVEQKKALENTIDVSFTDLTQRAIVGRKNFGTGEATLVESPREAAKKPSKWKRCCASLSACLKTFCSCCQTSKTVKKEKTIAVKTEKTSGSKVLQTTPESLDRKDDKPISLAINTEDPQLIVLSNPNKPEESVLGHNSNPKNPGKVARSLSQQGIFASQQGSGLGPLSHSQPQSESLKDQILSPFPGH